MDINIENCFAYIQANADKLGKAKGEIIRLEAKVKATKAALMEASDSSSVAMKEADSLKALSYLEVVKELADMTAEETKLGIMIKAAFQKVETHRAIMYLQRQEMRNLN
tara:strand:- start:881 stop:1207 length:327 start_codon:yes stop_codon:yes gene_type:complete